jgi:hypothetical protein
MLFGADPYMAIAPCAQVAQFLHFRMRVLFIRLSATISQWRQAEALASNGVQGPNQWHPTQVIHNADLSFSKKQHEVCFWGCGSAKETKLVSVEVKTQNLALLAPQRCSHDHIA